MVIVVSRDQEGVGIAARELLEESMREQQKRALSQRLAGADAGGMVPATQRSLSDGYYERAGYLLWLESTVALAPHQVCVDAVDLEGLKTVKAARAEFGQEHPGCPQCGTPREAALAPCVCGWRPKVPH